MATSKTRRRDKDATRAEIISAAEELFAAKGFEGTTLSEVAQQANVTKSLIHHHFGTKRELWVAVKEQFVVEYGALQRRLLETGVLDTTVLEQSIAAYFQFLSERPNLVRMLGWVNLDERCFGEGSPGHDLMTHGIEKIKEAQIQGVFRKDVDAAHIVMFFLFAVQQWHLSGKEFGFDPEDSACSQRFLQDLQRIMISGVKPQ